MKQVYYYCITDKVVEIITVGVNGEPVQSVSHNGLNIVYSNITTEIRCLEENIIAHESVLEELLKNDATILPFRFGTCVDEKSKEAILKEKHQLLAKHLDILRGKVEISVRALWNYSSIRNDALLGIDMPLIKIKNENTLNYLNDKMKNYKIEEKIKEFAKMQSETVHRQLQRSAVEGKYTLMKTNNMFFNGVYLVEKMKMNEFQSVYMQTVKENENYKFIITGPWPPYNFCNLNI